MAAISGSLATTSLLAALHKIEEQSDVTMEEARWLRQQVVRLIAEHETQTGIGSGDLGSPRPEDRPSNARVRT